MKWKGVMACDVSPVAMFEFVCLLYELRQLSEFLQVAYRKIIVGVFTHVWIQKDKLCWQTLKSWNLIMVSIFHMKTDLWGDKIYISQTLQKITTRSSSKTIRRGWHRLAYRTLWWHWRWLWRRWRWRWRWWWSSRAGICPPCPISRSP